jgi:hypothetical protein
VLQIWGKIIKANGKCKQNSLLDIYLTWKTKGTLRKYGGQDSIERDLELTHRNLRRGYSEHPERKTKG